MFGGLVVSGLTQHSKKHSWPKDPLQFKKTISLAHFKSPLVPVIKTISVVALALNSSGTYVNIILNLSLVPQVAFSHQVFWLKLCMHFSSLSCTLISPPLHSTSLFHNTSFYHHNNCVASSCHHRTWRHSPNLCVVSSKAASHRSTSTACLHNAILQLSVILNAVEEFQSWKKRVVISGRYRAVESEKMSHATFFL